MSLKNSQEVHDKYRFYKESDTWIIYWLILTTFLETNFSSDMILC